MSLVITWDVAHLSSRLTHRGLEEICPLAQHDIVRAQEVGNLGEMCAL